MFAMNRTKSSSSDNLAFNGEFMSPIPARSPAFAIPRLYAILNASTLDPHLDDFIVGDKLFRRRTCAISRSALSGESEP